MLQEVRSPLLKEARRSPSLLSDLAGLEQYVAESYDSRSFIKLLQNADDAGASRFVIQRSDDLLLVANDGRRFTRPDFESLCRSAASSQSRGTSIGYRGIGFKSVVSFAKTIHLVRGDLATTFSRESLLRHYGLEGRKIQTGQPNENGDIKQRHYRFQRALDQALLLRGSREFATGRNSCRSLERQQRASSCAGRLPGDCALIGILLVRDACA